MAHQVTAVLLAAGSSRRMGRPKQLLPIQNRPAIIFCVETIISSGVPEIVVVLGPRERDMVKALDGLPVRLAFNETAATEMADSVRTGLRAVDPASSAVLICLCDHPLVSEATIRMLLELHGESPDKTIIPTYRGKRGHPTLFPGEVMTEVKRGLTLRDVILKGQENVRLVEVPDKGVVLDMDTMEDYKRITTLPIP